MLPGRKQVVWSCKTACDLEAIKICFIQYSVIFLFVLFCCYFAFNENLNALLGSGSNLP